MVRTDGNQRFRPRFVAAKMVSTEQMAVAVEYMGGMVIGYMWLDLIDMADGVSANDIKTENNFRMNVWARMENCRWLARSEFTLEDYDKNIRPEDKGISFQRALPKPSV